MRWFRLPPTNECTVFQGGSQLEALTHAARSAVWNRPHLGCKLEDSIDRPVFVCSKWGDSGRTSRALPAGGAGFARVAHPPRGKSFPIVTTADFLSEFKDEFAYRPKDI